MSLRGHKVVAKSYTMVITYDYDELGRLLNRSINGAANAASVQYDSLGRVQNVTNPLGTFNYAYVNTTGRVDHVDYPNGQKAQYAYFDNLGDQRLKQIKNLDPSNAVISQFDYTYNPVGQITSWTQANSGAANPGRYDFGYDSSDQLRNARLSDTVTQASVHQYDYDYDSAGNRKIQQTDGAVTASTANNLNQLTSQTSGGKMHFRGTVNEPATVTVGGNPATVDAAGNFDGTVNANVGTNTVAVVATDASGNSRTNNYQINVPSGANTTLLYDLNGNLTNDGSKTYEWDASNRLIAINSGTHRTEMSYDGSNREIRRVEKENAVVTATKQFVWDGWQRSEERDANNQITKGFHAGGEQFSGSAYFYSRDHLGSIRELSDSAAAVHARYDYDPYGARTKLGGDLEADFALTGHYMSSLSLSRFRGYDGLSARWMSRDGIAEIGGINLYAYADNNPVNRVDPLGLCPGDWWDLLQQFLIGADEGAYAALDAAIPFWDPFSDRYNPNDPGIGFSQAVGGPALQTLALAGVGELVSAIRALGTTSESLEGAASLWDTSALPQTGRALNVATDVGAREFEANLISNGYTARSGINSAGNAYTVLTKEGGSTYTIYTATSTGGPSAQVVTAGKVVVKYRLGGP